MAALIVWTLLVVAARVCRALLNLMLALIMVAVTVVVLLLTAIVATAFNAARRGKV